MLYASITDARKVDERAFRAVVLSSSESVTMFSYVVGEPVQYFINCTDDRMGRMLVHSVQQGNKD